MLGSQAVFLETFRATQLQLELNCISVLPVAGVLHFGTQLLSVPGRGAGSSQDTWHEVA